MLCLYLFPLGGPPRLHLHLAVVAARTGLTHRHQVCVEGVIRVAVEIDGSERTHLVLTVHSWTTMRVWAPVEHPEPVRAPALPLALAPAISPRELHIVVKLNQLSRWQFRT